MYTAIDASWSRRNGAEFFGFYHPLPGNYARFEKKNIRGTCQINLILGGIKLEFGLDAVF